MSAQDTIETVDDRPLFVPPDDPVVASLIRYREDIEFGILPDPTEQAHMVAAVRQEQQHRQTDRDNSTRHRLITNHLGFVAATLYPFTGHGIASKLLMEKGRTGLLFAAISYNPESTTSFNDHSATVIRRTIRAAFPDVGVDPAADQGRPEDWIMEVIPDPYKPTTVLLDAPRRVRTMLPLLHLSEADIRAETGFSNRAYRATNSHTQELLGVQTRMAAALKALDIGVRFKDLRTPESLERFTIRQRVIAPMLDRNNPEIGQAVYLKARQVSREIEALMELMHARTRIEAAVIGRVHLFEPPKEGFGNPALREFHPLERDVASLIYLPGKEIAELVGSDPSNVSHALKKLREKTGTQNNVDLALELLRRGVTFDDIPPPLAPLNKEELYVALRLGPKYVELAESLGVRRWYVERVISAILQKTGARTQVEAALMLRMYPNDISDNHL